MRNKRSTLSIVLLGFYFISFSQAVDVTTCPTIVKRNNGNGQANLAAGIFVADFLNNPVSLNVVGTIYQTVPYPATTKTGDVNFSWPGSVTVTNLPIITRVWLTASGSTSAILSNIKFGPPPPPYLTGGTYRANYAFYNQNMPNSGRVTLEFTNPLTATPLFTCTYDLGGNTAATPPTIDCSPFINTQPASQSLCGATTANFSVSAVGVTSYQWQVSSNGGSSYSNVAGVNYSGATTPSLTISNPNTFNNFLYRVVLSATSCGSTTSTGALLQANPTPTAAFTTSSSVCGLGSRSLAIALTGTGPWSVTYSSTPTPGSASNTTITGITSSPYFISVSPAVPTVYAITAVSDAKCVNSTPTASTVSVAAAPTITPTNASACFGVSSFSLPFSSTGSPNQYSITAGTRAMPAFVPISNASLSASPLSVTIPSSGVVAGTYDFNINVTNSSTGCVSAVSAFTVTINTLPVITASANIYAVCSGSAATISATGGSTYSWTSSPAGFTSSASSVAVSPTVNTTYNVTGTSAAGCSGTGSVAITVRALPTASIAPSATTIQSGSSVSLTASGGSSYTWSGPSSYTGTGSTIIVAPTATGTYIVTATGSNGCTATASQLISVSAGLTIGVTAGSTICQNGAGVSLTGTGGTTYQWSPSTGLSATTGATITANPTTTTTYIVTGITGSFTGTASSTITVTAAPVTSVSPPQVAFCENNLGGSNTLTLSITSSSNQVYTWQQATTLPTYSTITATSGQYARSSAPATSELTSSLTSRSPGAGDQFFRVSFTSGGCTYTYPIALKKLGTATDITSSQTICSGSTPSALSYNGTTTSGSGTATTFTYSWESTTTAPGTTGFAVISGATSATYQPPALSVNTWYRMAITASIGTGCTTPSYSNTVAITVATAIANNTLSVTNACLAGATITGSTPTGGIGSFTYQWQSSTDNSIFSTIAGATSQNYIAPINAATRWYRRLVTSGTCSNATSSSIAVYPSITNEQINAAQTICSGASLTSLSVSPAGGDAAGSFTYLWSSSTDNSSFSTTGITTSSYSPPTTTGTRFYRVLVTRGACSTTSNSSTIIVNANPAVAVSPASTTVCSGGSVTLTASGATGYSWSPATNLSATTGSTVISTPVASRSYTVTGTDVNGCTGAAVATVTLATSPATPTVSNSSVTICSTVASYNLNSLVTSGTSGIEWYTAPTATVTYLVASPTAVTQAGTYYLYNKTGNCYSNANVSATLVINNVAAPVVSATSFTACSPATANLTALQPVANTGTVLVWHTVASGPSGANLVATPTSVGSGVYYLYAYSSAGNCFGTASSAVTVTINSLPSATVAASPAAVCSPSVIDLNTYNTTGNVSNTYQWYTVAVSPSPSTLVSNESAISVSGNYYLYATSTANCVGNASSALAVTINPKPSAEISSPATVCSGAGTSITATSNASSPTYVWEVSTNAGSTWATVTNGGVYTGATTATLSISNSTGLANNQYRYTVTNSFACSTTSGSALIAVDPVVSVGTNPANITVLQNNVANFSVTSSGSPTANFQWQVSTNSGSSYSDISDGAVYSGTNTPDLLVNNTTLSLNGYLYRCAISNNCTTNQFSTGATLTVTTACTTPTVIGSTPGSTCGTGTVVLNATASSGTINWYTASTGGSQLSTGNSYTTPSISINTTYYAEATLGAGCTSARTAVLATVNTVPTVSSNTPGATCGTGSVVLNATASSGSINWYAAITGGSSLSTGNSYTTPSININTTYYAEAVSSAGCTSTARTAVLATVNTIPTVNSTTPGSNCTTGTVVLNATASSGSINWYAAITSGSSLSTGNSYTTPSININTTYYAEAVSSAGCTSTARTAVLASVNTLPTTSFNYAGPYCKSEGTATVVSFSGTTGGTYSSTAGLSINASTGAITLSSSTAGTYTVTYSFTSNGCSNTATASLTIIATDGIWTGSANTEWNTPANWCSNSVPISTTDVVIPTGVTNMPSTSSAVVIRNLNIQTGTIIDISGDAFTFNGNITGTGTFSTNSSSSLTIAGSGSGSAGTVNFTNGSNRIGSLTINKTGTTASVLIGSPLRLTNVLTVSNGALNSNDNITLVSNASGKARFAAIDCSVASVNGNVTVERYITSRRAWRLLGVPVGGSQTIHDAWQEAATSVTDNPAPGYGTHITGGTAGNGFDQTGTNAPSIRVFSQTGTTVSLTARLLTSTNLPLNDETGYFVLVRGNRSLNLTSNPPPASTPTTLRSTGPLRTCTQTTTTAQGICDLVSNPYASAIDFSLLGRTNIPNRFFLWDPYLSTVGGYQIFDAQNGYIPSPGGGSYGNSGNSIIQQGQAFFIQGTIGAGSLVFNENAKVTGANNNGFRPLGTQAQLAVSLKTVNSDLSTALNDGTLVLFNNSYSAAIDNDDARKLTNVDEMFSLIRDDKLIGIEKRPLPVTDDTLFIKAYNLKVKNYQLVVTPASLQGLPHVAFLEDNFLNKITALSLTEPTTIAFAVTSNTASSNSSRFRIVFKPTIVLPVKLTNVKAIIKASDIEVGWTVAGEMDVIKYEIEKSFNGSTFSVAGFVLPVINSNNENNYKWLDKQATTGYNYYRIKVTERNGSFYYTAVVNVKIVQSAPVLTVYPNPLTNSKTVYQINNLPKGKYNVQLYNPLGQVIFTDIITHDGGNLQKPLLTVTALLQGIYHLKVSNDAITFLQTITQN